MEKEKREANRNTGLRAWMELREEHLAAHLSCLRKCLNAGADIMAGVKADGSGNGAEKVSRALEQMGVKAFAVVGVQKMDQFVEDHIVQQLLRDQQQGRI